MKIIVISLALLLLTVFSFAQNKGNDSFAVQENFFMQYKEIAQEQMKVHQIPASIKLAQAALESDWGRSELARNAKNFFGMKCKSKNNCTEKTYRKIDDDKDKNGNPTASYFQVFDTPEDSFYAHSFFLKGKKRYDGLFELDILDYKKWAEGLEKAGYATSKEYSEKLIKIIEQFNLHKIDLQVKNRHKLTHLQKDALAKIALNSAPSYPNQPERPSTTVNAFPSEKKEHITLGTASTEEGMINGVSVDVHEQNFGNLDVSNYQPEFQKMLQDESKKGGKSSQEKLKKYPPRKMYGGNAKPR